MPAYFGHLSDSPLAVEIFTASSKPTPATHPQYLAVVGPFNTKGAARGAVKMSNRWRNAALTIKA
jgi:hypothetical protein